ncbi:MAG: glycosyltransferase family 4 protein [Candidatus Brocadiaceae bacterium]|nr:glycosyltransferase family 4 protein [Candidatus Brocadiaceae bacterium]
MIKGLKSINNFDTGAPIKVLHVITRLLPGGAADTVLSLCHWQKVHGFQVELAAAPDPKMAETVQKMGIPFHPIPEFRRDINPFCDTWASFKLYKLIRSGGYQVVHTHTSKAGVLGRLAARFAQTPVIVYAPRGSIFHPTFFSLPMRWFFALIERLAAPWADKIITMSQSEVRDFLDYKIAPEEKFLVIPSGIDLVRFGRTKVNVAEKRQELGLPRDAFVIGIIARLSPEKGHSTALGAFQKVYSELPNAFLLIVGEGELKETIQQKIASMGIGDRVVMTGYRGDIPEITRILDISLNPSFWDCSPRSILEAMVCGVPVIATAVGGIPEMITNLETGLLVQAGDAEAIANCILRLKKDEGLKERMTTTAAKMAREKFDPSLTAKRTSQLYLELLAKKGLKG